MRIRVQVTFPEGVTTTCEEEEHPSLSLSLSVRHVEEHVAPFRSVKVSLSRLNNHGREQMVTSETAERVTNNTASSESFSHFKAAYLIKNKLQEKVVLTVKQEGKLHTHQVFTQLHL